MKASLISSENTQIVCIFLYRNGAMRTCFLKKLLKWVASAKPGNQGCPSGITLNWSSKVSLSPPAFSSIMEAGYPSEKVRISEIPLSVALADPLKW
jgi:hypothetical protein